MSCVTGFPREAKLGASGSFPAEPETCANVGGCPKDSISPIAQETLAVPAMAASREAADPSEPPPVSWLAAVIELSKGKPTTSGEIMAVSALSGMAWA
jgi:hypothetical protein